MLNNYEPKVPSVFKKYKRKFLKNFRYILCLICILLLLLFLFWHESPIQQGQDFLQRGKKQLQKYPETVLAHLDDKYTNWSLTDEIKEQLWEAIQKSPINEKTGRHYLMVFLSNAGMIEYTLNSLCSIKLAGVEKNKRITIALDQEAYDKLKNIDEPVILFEKNFTKKLVNSHKLVDFYNIVKIRPTIVHQFLLWNTEFIHSDSDIVYLKNPLEVFNDEADYEVQCDSKEYYQIPYKKMPVPWQVNLGFYKVHPSPVLLKLLPLCLKGMYEEPRRHDQSVMRKILKPYPTTWLNEDTVIVNTSTLLGENTPNITFRFLDPMFVTNAGGLYQEGHDDWKNEAKRRNIDIPTLVHFFHIGHSREKKIVMKDNNLWFVDKQNKCVKEKPKGAIEFKAWQ